MIETDGKSVGSLYNTILSMNEKLVNQFMAEKAGMAEVDRNEVYKKVQ